MQPEPSRAIEDAARSGVCPQCGSPLGEDVVSSPLVRNGQGQNCDFRFVVHTGNIRSMELSIDDVRKRAVRRRLEISPEAVASAVAALNAGTNIAFVPDDSSFEIAYCFATVLVATAAAGGFCIGSLELHEAAGALIPLRELLHERFIADLWLILTAPTPAAISKVVDEIPQLWSESDARLLVVTTGGDLRAAGLPPSAKRKLVPISL